MGAAFDLIVIGGGLVGGAIAWGAASKGAKVALLDEGDVAHRAGAVFPEDAKDRELSVGRLRRGASAHGREIIYEFIRKSTN